MNLNIPEAKQYLAIIVGSNSRVLLRRRPGPVGGYFIRTELSGNETPDSAIVAAVFDEARIRVRVTSAGDGVYFGGSGTCAYFLVEQVDPEEKIAPDGGVDWYSFEEAVYLMRDLKSDSEYELEIASLFVAQKVMDEFLAFNDDEFKSLMGAPEFESFKRLCLLVEYIFLPDGEANHGLGINSRFVRRLLVEKLEVIDESGGFCSDYVNNLISMADKKACSKKHEDCLVELILVSVADAYFHLRVGDMVGYRNARKRACKYLNIRRSLYPDESRAYRERARAGGYGKAKVEGERKSTIRNEFIAVLRESAPFRSRVEAVAIVDKVLYKVLFRLNGLGVKCDSEDVQGYMIDLLVSDKVVRGIIGKS